MGVYYNEFDKRKAQTLRNLIEEGAIAHGYVDERPIQAVQPEDLAGYDQHHFFAGGGVWSYALRLAGWPDDRPVWTGSCPCGPFSVAGKKLGFEDPRHLWPEWFRLIGERRPDRIFGEQSDAADAWIDLVSTDLESHGYAIGSPDIPAAGFGGAHIRQRFYWVADANDAEWWSERAPWHDGEWPKARRIEGDRHAGHGGADRWLADTDGWLARNGYLQRGWQYGQLAQDGRVAGLGDANGERERRGLGAQGGAAPSAEDEVGGGFGKRLRSIDRRTSGVIRMGEPNPPRLSDAKFGIVRRSGWGSEGGSAQQPGDPSGAGVDWLLCRDGAWRPVEPGTCPLVDEAPARMGRLRLYGDAIDAEAAANFIGAYLDAAPARAAA